MDNIMIRYDIFILRSVNSNIYFEEKIILINCSESDQLARRKNILHEQEILSLKNKARLINSMYSKQLNFEITLKSKIKCLNDNTNYKKKKICNFNIFDLVTGKFTSVNNFSEKVDFDKLLTNIRLKNDFTQVRKVPPIIKGLALSQVQLKEIITKIISEINFEKLSSNSGLFDLSDIGKKVLTDCLTIGVLPKEQFDDEGYAQKKVIILNKGILEKIFSLNENSILSNSYVNGFIDIDENRKKKILISDIFIHTREGKITEHIFDGIYEADKFKIQENNTITFYIRCEEGNNFSFEVKIAKFLNNLAYFKNTNQFVFFE